MFEHENGSMRVVTLIARGSRAVPLESSKMKKLNNKNQDQDPWHSRGYLPHFDGGEIVQFITFRLADSLPKREINSLNLKLEQELITENGYRKQIDRHLDGSDGGCILRERRIAELVEETLLHFDNVKYKLIAYVIMPNHVHLLIKPLENQSLPSIMHSIKSFTAHEANKILGRKGSFWSKEYFDRYIRDHEHLLKTFDYIANNPVKAKLCMHYTDWQFSRFYIGK